MTPIAWHGLTKAHLIGDQSALTLEKRKRIPSSWKGKSSSPGSIDRNGFSPTGTAGEFDFRHQLRGGIESSERLLKGPGDDIDSRPKRLSGDNRIDLIMYQVDDFHSFRQLMA